MVATSAGRATAEDTSREATEAHTRWDVGARLGYARSVGAFDAGTQASDTSHGGVPLAIDGTVRVGPPADWNIAVGVYGSWAETIPKLCASTAECVASLGRDAEIGLVARMRGPRWSFVLPEAEVGVGWSWSSRSLVDNDVASTRRWSGPVLLRSALVPSIMIGRRTRVGLVLGGSVARSTSFELEAPSVTRRGVDHPTVHGTFDIAFRIGLAPFD